MLPLKHPTLRKRVCEEMLGNYLRDNVKSRVMRADGSYVRAPANVSELSRRACRFNVQEFFISLAEHALGAVESSTQVISCGLIHINY